MKKKAHICVYEYLIMKYENFNEATVLVGQIKKYEDLLSSIQSETVSVVLNRFDYYSNSGVIQTIGVAKSYEHELQPLAFDFTDKVERFYYNKIAALKSQLELL